MVVSGSINSNTLEAVVLYGFTNTDTHTAVVLSDLDKIDVDLLGSTNTTT